MMRKIRQTDTLDDQTWDDKDAIRHRYVRASCISQCSLLMYSHRISR